ncbi:hypothetical protein JTE88_08940 [Arcanobacterium phocisimile]|uniref:Secreted protein n=1 Tax=Arcanobacterium phocisimile TaxID=1302235 RepID=A0ABX7IIC0_9ACTO|nr:DUF6049 family protein [Arcanobacterium phocisimile]QRV02174.1 hypothetical protein JTE88_08940 [Arcanobacterium phocisimile]
MKRQIVNSILATLTAVAIPLGGVFLPTHSPISQTTFAYASPQEPQLTITSVGEPTLAPGADLTLSVELINPTGEPMTITGFNVRSQSWPATTTVAVSTWLSGRTYGYSLFSADAELAIPAGQSITHTLTIPRSTIEWANTASAWGPRGIEVNAFTGDGDELSDRSFVIVTPDVELTRTTFTAVVPVVQPLPSHAVTIPELIGNVLAETENETLESGTGSTNSGAGNTESGAESQKAQTQAGLDFSAQWDFPGVTIMSDPMSDQQLDFKVAEHQPLPSFDADLAALAHSQNPERVNKFLRTGIPHTFIPAGPTDLTTLRTVRASGISTAILSDSELVPASAQLYNDDAHTTLDVDGEPMPIVVANATLSHAINGHLLVNGENIDLDPLDSRQAALAISAVLYRQQPNNQRAVAVLLPRTKIDSPQIPHAARNVAALAQAPWNKAASLTTLLSTPTVDFDYENLPETLISNGEINDQGLRNYDQALSVAHQVAGIFNVGSRLELAIDKYAGTVLSSAWRQDPQNRDTFIDAFKIIDRQAIRVEKSSTINLISTSSSLPVRVKNSYNYPITVTVSLDVPDSRLHPTDSDRLTIPANSSAQAMIPVEAWGSGNLNITVNITTASGLTIGESSQVHVRVRADWENTGTAVIALLVGALFITGVYKSIKKGRRSQPLDPRAASLATAQRLHTHNTRDLPNSE